MRTLTGQQQATLECAAGYATHLRVRVLRGSTWENLSSLTAYGLDFLEEASVSEAMDSPLATANVRCRREVSGFTLSHLATASALNLVSGTYAPLLQQGRTFLVEVAVVPLGMVPVEADWVERFRGRIDEPTVSENEVSFTGRDAAGLVQDTYIEEERAYGSDSGVPVQTVMQALLNDNGLGDFGLYTPVNPAWNLGKYAQKGEPVMDALLALARQLGWEVRWKWRAATSAFQLTLWSPERDATVPQWTYTADEYQTLSRVSTPLADVRNVVEVVYSDKGDLDASGNPTRKTVLRDDAGSAASYGRRFMRIAEGATSNIDTEGEAEALAERALKDLKDAPLTVEVEVPMNPFLELGDVVQLAANGVHFDVDQVAAVQSLTLTGNASAATITLTLRGQPSTGIRTWLSMEQRPGIAPASPFTGPDAPTATLATPTVNGASVEFSPPTTGPAAATYELHVSTTTGFTPSSSTLKATSNATAFTLGDLLPGDTYYVRVVPRDVKGNRGTASAEVSVMAGYVEPSALLPRVLYAQAPLNADFEGHRDPAKPPDAWIMEGGTWGVDAVTEEDVVYSGSRAVRFEDTIEATRLGSDYILVRPGDTLTPSAIFNAEDNIIIPGNDAALYVVWYGIGFSYLSSATVDQRTAGGSGWLELGRGKQAVAPAEARYVRLLVGKAEASAYSMVVDSVRLFIYAKPPDDAGVTLLNSWLNTTGGGYSVGYYRDGFRRVFLSGSVGGGALGTVAFTLPEGYRPLSTRRFSVYSAGGLSVTSVEVNANGNVIPVTGSATEVALDGIHFRANMSP